MSSPKETARGTLDFPQTTSYTNFNVSPCIFQFNNR